MWRTKFDSSSIKNPTLHRETVEQTYKVFFYETDFITYVQCIKHQ